MSTTALTPATTGGIRDLAALDAEMTAAQEAAEAAKSAAGLVCLRRLQHLIGLVLPTGATVEVTSYYADEDALVIETGTCHTADGQTITRSMVTPLAAEQAGLPEHYAYYDNDGSVDTEPDSDEPEAVFGPGLNQAITDEINTAVYLDVLGLRRGSATITVGQ